MFLVKRFSTNDEKQIHIYARRGELFYMKLFAQYERSRFGGCLPAIIGNICIILIAFGLP
jgi:hypothetical protein